MSRPTRGLIIGKFLPPHSGHKYLIDFARGCVDELTVLVCTLEKQPIPGSMRFAWMRQSFGDVRVIHHPDENPEEPQDAESPEKFWAIWKRSILSYLETPPDVVFASETYGQTLADIIGARYMPVDPARELVPTSGSAVRADSLKEWEDILPAARPYFVKRVAVIGPESSGKSMLAKHLAAQFGTQYVAEYARTYVEATRTTFTHEAIRIILRGQRASEEAMAQQCSGLLFCDTEAIVTKLWSHLLLGEVSPEVERYVAEDRYDLYLVTQATEEWVEDAQRFTPDFSAREKFASDCVAELEQRGRRYVLLSGDWEERAAQAAAAVEILKGEAWAMFS